MNSKIKKILSILLIAVIIVSMSACGKRETEPTVQPEPEKKPEQVSYSTPAKDIRKAETVYVNMSPEGRITNKVVTDWLHTDTAETYIDDISDLNGITNVKSDIQPVKNKDGSIRWNMQTTDLYYRGTTDRELPVSFNIDYYLDGKKMSADRIAGKSGQVKMVVTMINESFKETEIDGKKTKLYTPFIVAGGLILNETDFSNITVENGKAIGDGTKEIALMIGTPGLKESLNLSDDILKELGDFDFSSTYTITLDTEKFEISNMLFAVIPLSTVVTEINDTLPGTVTDVKEQLGTIQNVIDRLNKMNVKELAETLFANTDNLTELTASIGKVTQLYNDNKPLIDVVEKYMTDENMKAIKQFVDDTQSVDLEQVVELLSNPVLQRFFKQLPSLAKDMKNILPIIEGLSSDLSDPEVQKAVDNLPQTLNTLKELKKTVDDNQELFDALGKAFDEETSAELADIMSSLEGIIDEDTLSKYSGLLDNADELIERAQEWIKLGRDYNLFTTASKGTETSVLFVYETSPITAKPEKTTAVEKDSGLSENPIKTWFKNLFKKDN